jgi:hypothetical protein
MSELRVVRSHSSRSSVCDDENPRGRQSTARLMDHSKACLPVGATSHVMTSTVVRGRWTAQVRMQGLDGQRGKS